MFNVGSYFDYTYAIVRVTFLWRPTSFHEFNTVTLVVVLEFRV